MKPFVVKVVLVILGSSNFIFLNSMVKHFFCVLLAFVTFHSVFAVEDIFVTDTIKNLPENILLRQLYLDALCFKKQGKSDTALQFLKEYIKKDTTNSAVYMDLANMYIAANDAKTAQFYMHKAALLEPTNYWMLRTDGLLMMKCQNIKGAIGVYEKIVSLYPEKTDDVASLAALYTQVGLYDKASEQWAHYEEIEGTSDKLVSQRYSLYKKAGKDKDAQKLLDDYVALSPNQAHNYLVKANLLLNDGQKTEAEKLLKKTLKRFPEEKTDINIALMTLYLQTGEDKKAADISKKLLADKDYDFEFKRSLLSSLIADSAMSTYVSDADFKTLIKDYPENDYSYLAYAEYLLSKKDVKAFDYVRKAVEVNCENTIAWEMLLDRLAETNSKEYASSLEKAYQCNPNDGVILFYKGSMAKEAHDATSAIDFWVKSGEALLQKSDKWKAAVVYGLLADEYMARKEEEKAFAAYKSSLYANPTNSHVLNNYAYFLAEAGKDLESAERYSGAAVESNPNDPVFLDTYAWVYFKMGKITTARLYIEQALQYVKIPDADLYEHYGDIVWADGEKNTAWEYWKKALELSKSPSSSLIHKAKTGEYIK